ncbi:hypothetical protein F2P81_001945 [Scophthalmus maximus]|uniref:NICE-3 domain containing protein n=1 Tax=Scophthalmus maximus TaxID=52904 RepID=A0A6A4TCT2_SCOMX|nr:hypothetical protein F2P81_001945 [Scophthalmus maximus]
MYNESLLSSVNVVLVMAYGSLVFVLLFIFVKRQIMRFAVKSRRGPHVPLGHNAPKELKQEIEAKLCQVQKIHFEPHLPFRELGGTSTAVTGKRFRTWLLQLRNSHCMFRDSQSSLIDTAFGEAEFLKYQEALTELASAVKSHSGGSSSTPSQHHQSAAKDLTSTTEPASSSTSPDQTTYLISTLQQRSKRPRHFLELKNFKDNYNTLDSTL